MSQATGWGAGKECARLSRIALILCNACELQGVTNSDRLLTIHASEIILTAANFAWQFDDAGRGGFLATQGNRNWKVFWVGRSRTLHM